MGTSAIIRDDVRRTTPAGMAGAPPSPFLGILPPRMWERPKTFFTVPLDFIGLAAGETRPVRVQPRTDADFVAFFGSMVVRKGAALVEAPALLVDMAAEGGEGYNPQGAPVDALNLFGTARQPAVWAVPIIVTAGTGLIVRLNNAGPDALDVRMALAGFRVIA